MCLFKIQYTHINYYFKDYSSAKYTIRVSQLVNSVKYLVTTEPNNFTRSSKWSEDQNIGRKPINPCVSALCVPMICHFAPSSSCHSITLPPFPASHLLALDILSANSLHCSPCPPQTLFQRYLNRAVKILGPTPCRICNTFASRFAQPHISHISEIDGPVSLCQHVKGCDRM